jgi:hypothetical protein
MKYFTTDGQSHLVYRIDRLEKKIEEVRQHIFNTQSRFVDRENEITEFYDDKISKIENIEDAISSLAFVVKKIWNILPDAVEGKYIFGEIYDDVNKLIREKK